MKTLATTLCALILFANSAWGDDHVAADVQANNLTYAPKTQEGTAPLKQQDPTPNASALDLSLFGVISLGVIGLLWIRRHTSEL